MAPKDSFDERLVESLGRRTGEPCTPPLTGRLAVDGLLRGSRGGEFGGTAESELGGVWDNARCGALGPSKNQPARARARAGARGPTKGRRDARL
jgi:hypothetical protein